MKTLPNMITKKELAKILGVSEGYLRTWLNKHEIEGLKKLGYRKNQKYLTRRQLEFLFPDGLIIPKEFEYLTR